MDTNDLSPRCRNLICQLNHEKQWELSDKGIEHYLKQVVDHASFSLETRGKADIKSIITNYHNDSPIVGLLSKSSNPDPLFSQSPDSYQEKLQGKVEDKSKDKPQDKPEDQLYEYFVRLARKKFKFLPPGLEPEDVVNEAWVKILSKLKEFHYLSQFRTWCASIIVNTGIELIRRHGRSTLFSLDEPVGNGEQTLGATIPEPRLDSEANLIIEERSRIIRKAIDDVISLSAKAERNREILSLKLAGASGREIACQLNINVNIVNLVILRLRTKLKSALCEEANRIEPQKVVEPS